MANPKISTVFLQHMSEGGPGDVTGYLKHRLDQTFDLSITPSDLVVKQGGKTYDYPRADYVAPTPAPTPTPTPTKPVLTWTQKYPIGTNSKFEVHVGFFTVSGGRGPYTLSLSDYNKYRPVGVGAMTLSTIESPVGSGVDTLTAYVADGHGTKSDPITFTIKKVDGDGAGINSINPVQSFGPVWNGKLRTDAYPVFVPGAYGPGHADTRGDTISAFSDPSGVWSVWGAMIWSAKGLPPVGSYPVTGAITNKATGVTTPFAETLVVVPPIDIDAAAVQTSVWTDQTPAGTDVGYLAATTPDNTPTFVVNTPNLTVTAARRLVTAGKPPVGDFVWSFTVSSGGTALAKTFNAVWPIKKGIALAPTDMTLALNSLDNATRGQRVGELKVKGQSGGSYTILSQSGFNPFATTGQWGNPARYQVDKTGVFTPPDCLLSYQDPAYGWQDDQIAVAWTSDDAMTTCLQTFSIPVRDATNVVTLSAGDGPSLHAANVASNRNRAPSTKCQVNVAYNANPDSYTDATRGDDTKGGWLGPTVLNFLAGPNGEFPRLGGKADNTGVSSGITSYGKGFWILSDGDVTLRGPALTSGVHGGGSADGKEGLRKDGNTWGNFVLLDQSFQDCDQGIEAGGAHGYGYGRNISVRRCGGASVGAGLTHGFYIGSISKFTLEDSYIDATLYGHLLKCRARETIIRRCTIIDTGAAACCIDLPNGGDVLIEDCFIVKGPFAANPTAINFGAEQSAADGWALNRLTLNRNTIVVAGISYGGNYGTVSGITHYHVPGTVPSIVQGDGNKFWLSPGATATWDLTVYAQPGTTSLTNTTILPLPPKIPARPGLMTRPFRRRAVTEGAQYPNFNDVPVQVDVPFPYVTAPGKIATLVPSTDIEGGADKFAAGFSSALVLDQVHDAHGNPTPWAGSEAFRMDGGDLIYNGGLKPGGYFLQPQFKTLDGMTVSNHRIFVTIAA